MDSVFINSYEVSNNLPFVFIAGPCQIESLEHCLKVGSFLSEQCQKLSIPFIFKSSFDKANRTSALGKRGVGLEASLDIFYKIKKEFSCPIITDVHNEEQCQKIAPFVDILQIPAFLCRQTDLLSAAAKTGKVINVKKGQFLAPWDMKNIVDKLEYFGNKSILLTERGSCFGYNRLVVDFKSFDIMSRQTKKPIIFDATHSVQEPGGLGSASGGDRMFAPILSRAAIASSPIAGIFCEVHDNPDSAPSDGANMLNFDMVKNLLPQLKALDEITKAIKI
jgi:2-dehydro-3-deoxyphosphooctonate aldolase (KDO 8-P synthase)